MPHSDSTIAMDPQIIQANRKYRTIVLIAIVLCICVGAALIQWVFPLAMRYLLELEPHKSIRILQAAICLVFLSVLPIALYIWLFGRKVVKSQRMPPPGTKVIKNTRITEGRSATIRGKILMLLALLLLILALAGGIWLPWKLGEIMAEKTSNTPIQEDLTRTSPSAPRTLYRPVILTVP